MNNRKESLTVGRSRLAIVPLSIPQVGGVHTYTCMALDELRRRETDHLKVGAFTNCSWWEDDPESDPYRHMFAGTFEARNRGRIIGRVGARQPWQSAVIRPVIRAINPLPRAVDDWKPDMVFYPVFNYLAMWHNRPTAVAVHDLMHLYEKEFPEACARSEVREREVQYAQIAARASRILVDSELGGEMYLESYRRYGARRDQVRVVPFAAPEEFRKRPDAAQLLSPLGLPTRYMLYPAQFWKHKNHVRLLGALQIALKQAPDLHLVLVGSPRNGWESVRELISAPDIKSAVTHLGFVSKEQLILLYSAAHGLIYPSLFGPTNVPPLEAIGCGCPPAVADVYAARDQLGEMATYFDGRDIESIAEAMVRLWQDTDLRSRLITAGEAFMSTNPIRDFGDRLLQALL